jgi:hypothetical protein
MNTESVCILTGADYESASDCSTHRHKIESVSSAASEGEWALSSPMSNEIIRKDLGSTYSVTGIDVGHHYGQIVVFNAPGLAAVILREHNAHGKLVEALRALKPYLTDEAQMLDAASLNEGRASGFDVASLKARAALALAETQE